MMKKTIVYLDNDKYEVEIDDSIFDDYKVEACTRIIEKLFSAGNYKITPFMYCEDFDNITKKVKDRKFGTYNTYKLLINAGYHNKAEKLRVIFFKDNELDLAEEPIQSALE